MQDSVFTRIIKGEIPCYRIFEDNTTIAILDIFPIIEGHTLVIPKKQIDHLWDLSEEDYQALMHTTHMVARRLREVLQPARVGVKVMGDDVPHAHIHLIPYSSSEAFHKRSSDQQADDATLTELAKKLAF